MNPTLVRIWEQLTHLRTCLEAACELDPVLGLLCGQVAEGLVTVEQLVRQSDEPRQLVTCLGRLRPPPPAPAPEPDPAAPERVAGAFGHSSDWYLPS